MKTIHKFIILAMLGCLFMYSFSGCSSSTDTSSMPTGQQTISASDYKIKFSGDIWSSVVFHHKEHADRFGDCYECHYCAGVQGESLWNCRSCHTPGNTEGLCKDDGTHGCIMAQCNYCHEDLERNAGLDCADCHTDGALANTGHFVDSPVQGLDYQTNTISGVTDDAGTFYFWDGETISFFIADLLLGTAPAKTLMTPLDLIKGATDVSNPAVTNICRLLLSLDVDGNPDNGITISDAIKSELEGRSINFNQSTGDFGNNPDVLALLDTLNQLGVFTDNEVRSLCSAAEAQDHLTETLLSLNEEPTATNVAISGYPYVTYTLTGTYVYQDNDGDLESGSIYKWYRYDDDLGANEQEISGATSATYILTNADVGKYLKFEVIPSAATGKSPGNPVKSDAVGPIEPDPGNLPPTATILTGVIVSGSDNSDVNGAYQIANYTIYDDATTPVDGTLNGRPIYKHQNNNYWIAWNCGCNCAWRISYDTNKTNVDAVHVLRDGQNFLNYTAPMGTWELCPSKTDDVTLSENSGTSVRPFVNWTLTGIYTYSDAENDPQSGSTFKWYRYDNASGANEQVISGATSVTYTITSADIGKYLKFEVTPAAATGNSPGNPVKSQSMVAGPVIGIPATYTVSGAGTALCNGVYYFQGFHNNGSPYYKKSGEESYLFILQGNFCTISNKTDSSDPTYTSYYYYYTEWGADALIIPPEGGYERNDGLSPSPTVISSGYASP
jgi:predicted actin-binding protein